MIWYRFLKDHFLLESLLLMVTESTISKSLMSSPSSPSVPSTFLHLLRPGFRLKAQLPSAPRRPVCLFSLSTGALLVSCCLFWRILLPPLHAWPQPTPALKLIPSAHTTPRPFLLTSTDHPHPPQQFLSFLEYLAPLSDIVPIVILGDENFHTDACDTSGP